MSDRRCPACRIRSRLAARQPSAPSGARGAMGLEQHLGARAYGADQRRRGRRRWRSQRLRGSGSRARSVDSETRSTGAGVGTPARSAARRLARTPPSARGRGSSSARDGGRYARVSHARLQLGRGSAGGPTRSRELRPREPCAQWGREVVATCHGRARASRTIPRRARAQLVETSRDPLRTRGAASSLSAAPPTHLEQPGRRVRRARWSGSPTRAPAAAPPRHRGQASSSSS